MGASSAGVWRQLSGTRIAPALPQANSTSKNRTELWHRIATRSPAATPIRSNAAAPRSARSLNCANVSRRPVSTSSNAMASGDSSARLAAKSNTVCMVVANVPGRCS